MKKLIFSLMIGIFLISLVSATPHQQFKDYDLIVSSNNATNCNLTYIQYPNGSKVIQNLILTKDRTSFYKTINSNNYSQLGETIHGILFTDGISIETGSVVLDVTPDGNADTLGFFFLVLTLSLGVIILGFSLKDAQIVILGSFGLHFLGIRILFYGLNGLKDPIYTWAIGLIILGVAAYISIKCAWELIGD